jgi:hypothetical protein
MKGFLEKRHESLMTIVKRKEFEVKINMKERKNNSNEKKINKNINSTGSLKIDSIIKEEK